MRRVIGYMLTWTTYGSWLQGDERGYVSGGKVFGPDTRLLWANRSLQKQDAVLFNRSHKEVVRNAIRQEAVRLEQEIHAMVVWSSHVHLVVNNINVPIKVVAARYKRAASAALHKDSLDGKIWTRSYDKRYCFDGGELRGVIDYVEGHGD